MSQMQLREKMARRLRELMDASETLDTQVKVAKRAGIGQASVHRILARDQSATLDMLELLADAFGIKRAEYFLLDAADIQLLQQWAHLPLEDKEAVLGFIEVRAALKKPVGTRPLAFHSKRAVPDNLVAALNKASSRPLNTAAGEAMPEKKKHDEPPARNSRSSRNT